MTHSYRPIELNSPGIIRRVLLALGVVKPLMATDVKPNWHWNDVQADSNLTTIAGVRDGVPYCRTVQTPPEQPARQIRL